MITAVKTIGNIDVFIMALINLNFLIEYVKYVEYVNLTLICYLV